MVSFWSVNWGKVPLPNSLYKWLINGGMILTTGSNSGMALVLPIPTASPINFGEVFLIKVPSKKNRAKYHHLPTLNQEKIGKLKSIFEILIYGIVFALGGMGYISIVSLLPVGSKNAVIS